jgi:MFS family permease
MESTERKHSLRASLSHRDFRYLLFAFAVSKTGDWLYSVALLVYVFNQTHSAGWVGAAAILRFVPILIFSPFGGVLADRYERRRVMISSDLIRAFFMFALAVVAALSGSVVVVLILVMASAAASTPYAPALGAITPSLVPEEDLAAANSSMSVVDNLAIALGPALGGVLLALGAGWFAFAFNGATFLVSAALVVVVKTRSQANEQSQETSIVQRTLEGFRAATESSDAAILLSCIFAATALYGQESVLLILVSKHLLGTGSSGAGFLFAATGLGGLLGAGLTSRLAQNSKPGRTLALSMCLSGAALIALSFVHWAPLAYAIMTVDGIGYIILDVLAITLLQRTVSSDVLARVFGIFMTLAVGGTLLGSIVAPITSGFWGVRVALIVAGASLPAIALLAAPKLRAMNERAQDKMLEVAPVTEMLAGLGIFQGASPQALESLAQTVREEKVASGTDVVTEGEEANDFFVVKSGAFAVVASGEEGSDPKIVNSLKEGDYFGEIGLLEKIPRTATVHAVTDSIVYRIGGEAFVDAVSQVPSLQATLSDGIVGRLSRTHPSHRVGVSSGSPQGFEDEPPRSSL